MKFMKHIREIFREDSKYRPLLLSILITGLAYGLYKGMLDNFLAEVVKMGEMDRGITEFFRELPGVMLVLILAVFYMLSAETLYKAGAMIMLLGMGMHAVLPATKVLATVADDYDYILIDCSPSLGLITINALTASDSVIIPVQCEFFALEGIAKLLNTIKIIKSKLNPGLGIEGFLLTMYDSRLRLSNQVLDEVRRHFQELVFDTVIQRNVRLSEAPSHGIPAILYDAESKGAQNYLTLAQEIIKKNG